MAKSMSEPYRVCSLFAGIGGICLGFKEAGAEIVWANENDPKACETYRHNFDKAPYLVENDINITPPPKMDIDLIVGGFPCQAFSVAGYRQGFDDKKGRGQLFFRIMDFIHEKKPPAVFLENVKNLKTHDNCNTYHVIKNELENAGYRVDERVLNTMEYGDIPQNRERIYIVAFRESNGSCPEMDAFQWPEPVQLTKGIHSIINIHEKKDEGLYYKPDHAYFSRLDEAMTNPNTVYQWRRVYVRENKSNVCPTLTANMGTGGHNVPLIRDDFGIRKLTPDECLAFQGFPEWFSFPENMANCHRYKQAGNSVSVPVIRRIAENMLKAMDSANTEKRS